MQLKRSHTERQGKRPKPERCSDRLFTSVLFFPLFSIHETRQEEKETKQHWLEKSSFAVFNCLSVQHFLSFLKKKSKSMEEWFFRGIDPYFLETTEEVIEEREMSSKTEEAAVVISVTDKKSRKSLSSFDSQWEKRAVSHTFRVSFIPRNRPNQLSFSRDKILRVKWQQEEDKTEQKVKTMWEQNKWHEWVQEEERHMKDRYELWKRECVWILFSLHTKLSVIAKAKCQSAPSIISLPVSKTHSLDIPKEISLRNLSSYRQYEAWQEDVHQNLV